MKLKWLVRFYLIVIAVTAILAITRAVKAEGWPTKYETFQAIRIKAKALSKRSYVCFTLNSGEVVYAYFVKYDAYDDYIWYQPLNTAGSSIVFNWFKQDAYDVRELASFDLVIESKI